MNTSHASSSCASSSAGGGWLARLIAKRRRLRRELRDIAGLSARDCQDLGIGRSELPRLMREARRAHRG